MAEWFQFVNRRGKQVGLFVRDPAGTVSWDYSRRLWVPFNAKAYFSGFGGIAELEQVAVTAAQAEAFAREQGITWCK
jgi:hypothetical protein